MINIRKYGLIISIFLNMREIKVIRIIVLIIDLIKNKLQMILHYKIVLNILKQMNLKCQKYLKKFSNQKSTTIQLSGSARYVKISMIMSMMV